MRAVVQRVSQASARTEEGRESIIGPGLVVLLGVAQDDEPAAAEYLAGKVAHLRLFEDEEQRLNRSVLDLGGEVLAIPNFTLFGDVRRGRRPSFTTAAGGDTAEPLYEHFVTALRGLGVPVACGWFGAHMHVDLCNDGPVTILLDSRKLF